MPRDGTTHQGAGNAAPPAAARWTIVLSAASFGTLGACLTLPGTLLPLLVEQFGIRLVEAGSMLALQPAGYLLSVMAARRVIDGVGMRRALSAGVLLFAAGLAGFGVAGSWVGGALMMFVSGLGFGVAEVALNTLLIHIGGERRANLLNFTHLFFGVGSFSAPPLIAYAVAGGVRWRVPFLVGGIAMGAVGAGWGRAHIDATAGQAPGDGEGRPRAWSRLGMLLAAILGVYVGVEMGIGGWLTKYMVSQRRVTLTYAGNTLSLYWMGLAAGRLALSWLSHRFGEGRLLVGLTLVAAVALPAALLAPTAGLAAVGFAVTGAGFSGIFPIVIAIGGRHHPHDVAGITSVMITGAGIGGIVVPWAMSAIADLAGVGAGMAFYAVMGGSMVALAALIAGGAPEEGVA
jgi:fucose permease